MGDNTDSEQNEGVNALGPAAQSADPNVSEPVSGNPAGGPHDLGKKAAEKQDATG